MSNPFKTKKLVEFTIADCESYLSLYPYGEHYLEVQERLEGLKSSKIAVRNNPFSVKPLSEFSIQDCYDYLKNNENGCHDEAVKKHLEKLINQTSRVVSTINMEDSTTTTHDKRVRSSMASTQTVYASDRKNDTNMDIPSRDQTPIPSEPFSFWDDMLKPLLSVIVVVGIVSYFTGKPPKKTNYGTGIKFECRHCDGSGYWPYLYWGLIKFDCTSCKGEGYVKLVY